MKKRPFKKNNIRTSAPSDNDQRVIGIHAVKASLLHMPKRAQKLHIMDSSPRLQEIANLAKQVGVITEKYQSKNFAERFGSEFVHQGVILETKTFPYVDLSEFIDQNKVDLCVVLDGIEDQRNLGRAARSALAFGAQLIVIAKDRSAQITATTEKAAVGCLAEIPVAQVTNLKRALEDLKKAGLWVVGAAGEATLPSWKYDFKNPTALVIGSEEKGIRHLVREQCDQLVKIPMTNSELSLNAADAATVLLYEIKRQRQK